MKRSSLWWVALSATLIAADRPPRWPSESVYHLVSRWTDQAGKQAPLSRFAGHPVLLAMVYTQCEASCPITVSQMRAIEAKLSPKAREAVRLVLVSFDPARDTRERLAEVAAERHLGSPRWTLLTGAQDQVDELAVVLGFKYQRLEGGDFSHSNLLTVLGPDGVIRGQLNGLGQDPQGLIEAIQR